MVSRDLYPFIARAIRQTGLSPLPGKLTKTERRRTIVDARRTELAKHHVSLVKDASHPPLEPFECVLQQLLMQIPFTNRREVEAAQVGAAAEQRARTMAEASLTQARSSLRETHQLLQESLANGTTVALTVLLEEKNAAEAKAEAAVTAAEAATTAARAEARTAVDRLAEERKGKLARGAEANAIRDKELTKAKLEREEVRC